MISTAFMQPFNKHGTRRGGMRRARRRIHRAAALAGASPLVLPRRQSSRGTDFLETRRRHSFRGPDFLETRRRHSFRGTDLLKTPKGDKQAARSQSGASFQHTRHSTKRVWHWARARHRLHRAGLLQPSSRRQIFPKRPRGSERSCRC